MRTFVVFALLAMMACTGSEVLAQAPAAQKSQGPSSSAAAEIAARPDAFRYYWHNGTWWYFTPQNAWLRWNGSAWIVHHSINEANTFAPAPVQQQPTYIIVPGPTNSGPAYSGPTYRYEINRRKGGL